VLAACCLLLLLLLLRLACEFSGTRWQWLGQKVHHWLS